MTTVIQTDGSCIGNGKPHDYIGVAFSINGKIYSYRLFIENASSNEAEYYAIIMALVEAKKLGLQDLIVRADSQLIIYQITGKYSVKSDKMKDLWNYVRILSSEFKNICFQWIPREKNSGVDSAAKIASGVI